MARTSEVHNNPGIKHGANLRLKVLGCQRLPTHVFIVAYNIVFVNYVLGSRCGIGGSKARSELGGADATNGVSEVSIVVKSKKCIAIAA